MTNDKEITALLVIDPYNDFISAGGKIWDRVKGQGLKKICRDGRLRFAQFDEDGKPGPEADLKACFSCPRAIKDRDLVFTRYAP